MLGIRKIKSLVYQKDCIQPKVSVHMITYNHAAYIAQAIESVLMQETDFEVELVIGDDCSTDETQTLLRNYARRFPGIIKLLLQEKNIGMQRNAHKVTLACRGDYIAYLEGDDYWTASDKLLKQVRMLEADHSLALSHHRVSHYDESKKKITSEFPPQERRMITCGGQLLAEGNFIQTCSLLVRRKLIPKMSEELLNLKMGDWPLCALVSQYGLISYIDENMSTYRLHENSAWSSTNFKYREEASMEMIRTVAYSLNKEYRINWVDKHIRYCLYNISVHAKSGCLVQVTLQGVRLIYDTIWLKSDFVKDAMWTVKENWLECAKQKIRKRTPHGVK
jgi:glycosyltransferase involved in cell wall biosynthesis